MTEKDHVSDVAQPASEGLLFLASELEAYHDCADGDVQAGNGHFRLECVSESEQHRLNLRAVLRDAAKALRLVASQPSPAATVETLNEQAREHPRFDNPRDPFASPDRLPPSSSAGNVDVNNRPETPHWERRWQHDQPNVWNRDADKFLALIKSAGGSMWLALGRAKYLEMRIDTRDCGFNLYDRDGKPLNPDDVVKAVEEVKEKYGAAVSYRDEPQSVSLPDNHSYDLEEALHDLVSKLEIVHAHPRFIAVWTCAHFRLGPYDGPTYDQELVEARAALALSRPHLARGGE